MESEVSQRRSLAAVRWANGSHSRGKEAARWNKARNTRSATHTKKPVIRMTSMAEKVIQKFG
jgi:hypothetical protein